MEREELNQFLEAARSASLVDYLDPLGETPEEALDRRIRWAKVHATDPSHGEEATFLLDHALALRRALAREVRDAPPPASTPEATVDFDAKTVPPLAPHELPELPELPEEDEETEVDPFDPNLLPTNITRMEDLTPVQAKREQAAEAPLPVKPSFTPPVADPSEPTLPPMVPTPPPSTGRQAPQARRPLVNALAIAAAVAAIIVTASVGWVAYRNVGQRQAEVPELAEVLDGRPPKVETAVEFEHDDPDHPQDLGGTWTGTLAGLPFSLTVDLHVLDMVSGSATWGDSTSAVSGSYDVASGALTLSTTSGELALAGSVHGSAAEGSVTAGPEGTWSLSR